METPIKKHKYVGEVVDDSWYKAVEENNIISVIRAIEKDVFESAFKKFCVDNGWQADSLMGDKP